LLAADGMAEAPLLRIRDLWKTYPTGAGEDLHVLQGADLTVEAGEIVAIVGESGSGKSTLLHITGTLERPTKGTVEHGGRAVFALDDEALADFRNTSIGFVFQFHHLLPEFDALENVAMPALIQGQRFAAVRPRATELLDAVGLSHRLHHRPGTLSGGEQQRVAVARALMNAPDLILADEPTGNVDARTAEALHEEILRLSRSLGQTFILVTHNPALAAIADRVLRLRHGVLAPAEDMAPG